MVHGPPALSSISRQLVNGHRGGPFPHSFGRGRRRAAKPSAPFLGAAVAPSPCLCHTTEGAAGALGAKKGRLYCAGGRHDRPGSDRVCNRTRGAAPAGGRGVDLCARTCPAAAPAAGAIPELPAPAAVRCATAGAAACTRRRRIVPRSGTKRDRWLLLPQHGRKKAATERNAPAAAVMEQTPA